MISIVVPLYNEGQRVKKLIAHLRSLQGFGEAILVDASDQADSKAVVEQISDSGLDANIIIKSTDQLGRSLQMNLGADFAKGNILLFLHCDTRLPEDAMALIEDTIQSGHSWGRFDVMLESKGFGYRLIERMIGLRSRVRSLATGDQGIFVTASLFNTVGGFPQIPLMEDIAMSKSLGAYSKPRLINKPVITSARRWQNKGMVRTILLMWKLRFLYWVGVDPHRLDEMYGNER